MDHLRYAYGGSGTPEHLPAKKAKKLKVKNSEVISPEKQRHAVPVHLDSKFFVQAGVKNVRSPLKLNNLKGLSIVSEKVELNITASKFNETDTPPVAPSPSKQGENGA